MDSTSDRRSPDAVDAIDVLFVIDGDLRTGQVAQRLAGATARFFERLGNTNTNYRVGVVHAQGLAGIGRANLVGQPTVISPTTPSPAAALAARLTAPGVTLGRAPLLEVAREATTVPARTSGPNAGFLRLDGQLEVIVVTVRDDEDDDTVSSTLEALGDRPLGRPRAIRVHAISGGPNGCGSGAGADLADPTERLARAVALTGGVEISACAEDFATALSDLAGALRQPHAAVLQLSSRPVAGTVVIANPPVGGAEWSVDHQRARVVYDPHPAAQPVGNVVVQWRPWCVASTCGDGRVDPGEMCDDDNRRDTDACVTTCHAAACGDGATYPLSEFCDDANLDDEDGCTRWCTVVR